MRWLGLLWLALGTACGDTSRASTPQTPAGGTNGGGAAGGSAGSGSGGNDGGISLGCLDANGVDDDGDGVSETDGDCDDCEALVNPGAFDVAGNGVDEDCSGKPDDEPSGCDGPLPLAATDPVDLARAIGLCRLTTADAKGGERTWGLLSAKLTETDGTSPTDPLFSGILVGYGKNNHPREGKQLLALSSGTARGPTDPGSISPSGNGYARPELESAYPPGFPQNAQGCPEPFTQTANDSVRLELEIRVPTNANSLAFDFSFFTTEWPEWICSEFNDTFVSLLETQAPLDPSHHGNVSFDAAGNPVSINVSFFGITSGPVLAGTWMAGGLGGGTDWLTTEAPVVPGETIRLSFAIWDTSDHKFDSLVLLDAFRWSVKTVPMPETRPTPR
ncbi:MAG: choice-of-anchor L domain-containing protein [Polyangiaceae bacterium]